MAARAPHGDRYIQTNQGVRQIRMFERDEWEARSRAKAPDLDLARGTRALAAHQRQIPPALKPMFETGATDGLFPSPMARTPSRSRSTAARSIPASARRLCARSTSSSSAANQAELFEIARELTRALPRQLAFKSKSERGYELLRRRAGCAGEAAAVDLVSGTSTRDAFKDHRPRLLEAVVATSRRCSKGELERCAPDARGAAAAARAMSLFGGILGVPQTAEIKAELKMDGGRARPGAASSTWLMKRVLAPVKKRHARWDGVASLSRDFAERHEAALARAQNAVKSARFRALTLEIAAWLRPASGRSAG